MSRPVEQLSRTQRDLQRLDGRRGPPSARAVTWGDLDELLAQIAARSRASNGKFAEAAFGGSIINGPTYVIENEQIVSPYLDAPTGLTITSTVNEATGVSFFYVDWDDFEGASGYHLGISLDNGGEFIVPAPSSFFQDSVIAGTLISVRVRALNSLNMPGAWSAYVNHIAQADTTPPPVPTGLKITAAFNGFWLEWDPSPAIDISRYDILESELPTPAPTAATNPSFTSASAVFFRGSLPNGATRSYRIRAVDYSENASEWTAPITATTVVDPGELLDLLEGQITESQLFADLGSRIDLIDGPAAMLGSVAQRLAAEAQARADSLAAEALARGTAITNEQTLRQSADEALAQQITTISAVVGSNTAAIQTEQTARATADSAIATDVTALDSRLTTTEGNVTANASAVSSLDTRVTSAEGTITSTSSDVTALKNVVNDPITGLAATAGALETLQTAVSDSDTGLVATAEKVTNLQVKIDDPITGLAATYAAFQQEAEIRAEETGNLFGQYTVKIDLDGYVSGFGLSSEAPVDETPSSEFVVRADSFSVAGTGAEPEIPFIVRTSGTTIGGQYVPPGVYIRDGFIQNGTITTATIADAAITDAKIQELSAAKLIAGSAIANSVLVNGQALGTIQQNADNPAARINAASTNILPGRITINGPATLLDWTASGDRTQIDGGRIFTNSISASSIDTIELAADSAFVTNLTSTGTSFMNQLIVRTANIDDASITTAKIGLAEVDTLRIRGNAVTIPSAQTVSNSVIGNGAFQEIQFFNHTLDEAGTLLIIFSGAQGYSSGNTFHTVQLRVDGVTVTSRGGFFAEDYPTLAFSASFSAGTRRIAIWWSADSSVTFNNRTLIVLGVKR